MGKQGSNLLKDEATGSTGENASIGEEESKRKDERQFYWSVSFIVFLIVVDIFIFRALKDGLQALCILILEGAGILKLIRQITRLLYPIIEYCKHIRIGL